MQGVRDLGVQRAEDVLEERHVERRGHDGRVRGHVRAQATGLLGVKMRVHDVAHLLGRKAGAQGVEHRARVPVVLGRLDHDQIFAHLDRQAVGAPAHDLHHARGQLPQADTGPRRLGRQSEREPAQHPVRAVLAAFAPPLRARLVGKVDVVGNREVHGRQVHVVLDLVHVFHHHGLPVHPVGHLERERELADLPPVVEEDLVLHVAVQRVVLDETDLRQQPRLRVDRQHDELIVVGERHDDVAPATDRLVHEPQKRVGAAECVDQYRHRGAAQILAARGDARARHRPPRRTVEAVVAQHHAVEAAHDFGIFPDTRMGIRQPALPFGAKAAGFQVAVQHAAELRHLGRRSPGSRAQVGLEILAVTDDALALEVEQRRTVADRQHRGIDEHLGGLGRGGRRGQRQQEGEAPCRGAGGSVRKKERHRTAGLPSERADRTGQPVRPTRTSS